ncbi:MAG: type 1 glutamine amidotransferase [Syntrophorhabdaceae bacterium]|nr:type 1 glutamine amidotransferase [Syntrophorhabdaceae bacterium]
MDVLIIKNSPNEGPGNILPFLIMRNLEYHIIEAYTSQKIEIPDDCRFLIVLGGPMGVYEMEDYPFLKTVAFTIEDALTKHIKVLGICLGAQLFAHVLGSRVYKGPYEELGWCGIELSEKGLSDSCFKKFKNSKDKTMVFQWHGDTFDLPKGCTLLASSTHFPHQAFKYETSYAVQFHPEVTPDLIRNWSIGREDIDIIENDTENYYMDYWHKAWLFYDAFFSNE